VRYYRTKDDGRDPCLRISTRADSNIENIPYILMAKGPEKRSMRFASKGYMGEPYVALGWIYLHDAISDQYRSSMSQTKYEIPLSQLRSMEELLPIRKFNLGVE
jgi:hypothetical protein